MNTPRIYIVIGTFYPLVGGAETQALAQGKALRQLGYEAKILTFRHKNAWPVHDTIDGVPLMRVGGTFIGARTTLPRKIQQFLYMLALIALGWRLWQERHHYDVLHVYQLSLLTLPTAIVCRLAKKPMLIAVRSSGSGKTSGSHHTSSLLAGPLDPTLPWLQIEAETWVDGDLEGLVRMGKRTVHFARTQLLKLGAVVIVLSSRMKSYLAAHDFLLPSTRRIPNGVDIVRFHPTSEAPRDQTRSQTVVCVAKLRYEKGIDVLLQAWHLVHKEQPQARLLLVGSGPIQPQLTHMAEALEITDSVEFVGLQSDVVAQLHRSGIAVLPSRWEGMPNALLEAMACGLACVSTRVSGSEDIIEHGVNGLLVDIEDYEGMARALVTLLQNPTLAQNYGKNARLTIEQQYALDHITSLYIELYQTVFLNNANSTPSQLTPDTQTSPLENELASVKETPTH